MAWIPPGAALLFCPADRPERFSKALDRADAVILDLEDAVAPEARPQAREALCEHASDLDLDRVVVRVNSVSSEDFAADCATVKRMGARVVMLAKTESAEHIDTTAEATGAVVLALIETPAGVVNAPQIAAASACVGMMWGAEDLVAAMGGATSRFSPDEAAWGRHPGQYRDAPRYARSAVALAAHAHGRFAVDSVHLEIADIAGLRAEAMDAVALGYAATACIHPSQVPVIHEAYAPPAAEVSWARRVLAEAKEHPGVFRIDGRMIDGPVIAQAHATMRRAAVTGNP